MGKTNEMPNVTTSKTDEIFKLVKTEKGIVIAIGNHQISKMIFKTKQAAEDYLKQKPYEVIINIACMACDLSIKQLNLTKNEDTKKDSKNA